jgi:hypothetical protein
MNYELNAMPSCSHTRLVCIFYALQTLCCCSVVEGMQRQREEICIFCITRGSSDALIRHSDNSNQDKRKETQSQSSAHLHGTHNLECVLISLHVYGWINTPIIHSKKEHSSANQLLSNSNFIIYKDSQ